MTKILSIDTSTSVCSVALHEHGHCLGVCEISEQNAHSSQLTVLIQQLLSTHGLKVADIHAVAISQGPGSYTGLRIGTSVAKGLCFAAHIPLIAVDTLMSLALQCKTQLSIIPHNAMFVPMIDARRMEVYTAIFDNSLISQEKTNAKIITETTLAEYDSAYTYFLCGDGSEKCKELLSASHMVFVPHVLTSAQSIGTLAYDMYCSKIFADLAYFEPLYLKEFQTTTPKNKF